MIQERKMQMKNKKSVIILSVSLVLILASIAMLVVYFLCLKPDSKSEGTFTVSCANISANVGDEVRPSVILSDERAEVQFEIENNEIASCDGLVITALKPGMTMVNVTATLDDKIAYCTFYLTVMREGYTFEIVPVSSCYYENEILSVEGENCQFRVELYNNFDELVDNPDISISHSENIEITTLPFGYLLSASGEGKITFSFTSQNFAKTISVQTL